MVWLSNELRSIKSRLFGCAFALAAVLAVLTYPAYAGNYLVEKQSAVGSSTLLLAYAGKSQPPSIVREAQSYLQQLGYYKGKRDGVMDRDTSLALMKFKRAAKIRPGGGLTDEVMAALRAQAKEPSRSVAQKPSLPPKSKPVREPARTVLASAPCVGTDPTDFDQVFACMSSARWSRGMSAGRNRFEGNIATSSCSTIARTYAAVLNEKAGITRAQAKQQMPGCDIFARATREISGKEAYWEACIGYGRQSAEAHLSRCLQGYVKGYFGSENALTEKVTGCASALSYYERGVRAASADGQLPPGYQRPDCQLVFASLGGKNEVARVVQGCAGYSPETMAEHVNRCIGPEIPLARLHTCAEVRRVYEGLLVEAHGGLPANYIMMPCSAAAPVLARADAEREQIAERQRKAAIAEQKRRAEIEAARNRSLKEFAERAEARNRQAFGAGTGTLVSPEVKTKVPAPAQASSGRTEETSQTSSIDFTRFEQPKLLAALYSGQFDALQGNRFGVVVYISHMHHTLSDDLMEVDHNCTLLTDTEMDRGLTNVAMEVGGLGTLDRPASRDEIVEAGAEQLMGMLMMFRNGPQQMMRQGAEVERLKEQGRKDAIRMASKWGCESAVTEKIYENAKRYVLRRPPA
ncbi:peptidoglycan-binding protein [Marinobacterium sp. YM272]|uniref:peptidoglycan-binding domain-containing protein n=1 Tax=Marinobacterium sp. YM272 TaxID=3421654 RepID=UPI003D7FD09A